MAGPVYTGTLHRYYVEYHDGPPVECDSYQEALQFARNTDGAVVEYSYEFTDTQLVDDFRPRGPDPDDYPEEV